MFIPPVVRECTDLLLSEWSTYTHIHTNTYKHTHILPVVSECTDLLLKEWSDPVDFTEESLLSFTMPMGLLDASMGLWSNWGSWKTGVGLNKV
jgi:hypothetical protein